MPASCSSPSTPRRRRTPCPPRRAAGRSPGTTPTRSPASWRRIEKRRIEKSRKPETVLLTQGEVNSYLNLTYAEKLPKGVRDVEVRLDRDRILAKGLVNIDRVKGKVGEGGGSWGPLSFLSGDVPVEITGKVIAKDGFGQVTWESVYLASMRVPISVLEQLVLVGHEDRGEPRGVRHPRAVPPAVLRQPAPPRAGPRLARLLGLPAASPAASTYHRASRWTSPRPCSS